MKLYSFFRSSAAYRMRIALNLKGLAYEMDYVSLPKMEQRKPEFLAINPQGLVPALVDGDQVLIQSMAIIEYLDETHPTPPRFIPDNPLDRAYVRALSQVVACETHPLNNVRVLNYLRDALKADDAARQAWYEHWIELGLGTVESLLKQKGKAGKFCFGDSPTMADVCLVPQVFNAQRFNCPLDGYPTVMRIFEACQAMKPFADAHPSKQKDAV
jgi:maleylacetoacetate isomerase